MGLRRVVVFGVAGAMLAGSAACAPVREPEGADPAAADARAALVAAIDRVAGDTVTVTQDAGTVQTVTRIDPRTLNAAVTVRSAMTTGSGIGSEEIRAEVRALGDDSYLQLIGVDGIDGTRWIRIDRAKLDDTVFGDHADSRFEMLGDQIASVRGTAPHFNGTVWFRDHVDGFVNHFEGSPTTTIPFAATTDTDGRLTVLVVDPSPLGGGQARIRQTFSGFGDPVTVVAPPAALTVEGTDEMLAALGIG
jgi:hypothetical protein